MKTRSDSKIFEDVKINFINDDIAEIIKNKVEPIILNVTLNNSAVSAKDNGDTDITKITPAEKKANQTLQQSYKCEQPKIKLRKTVEELNAQDIILDAIKKLQADQIYTTICSSEVQEIRRNELITLKAAVNETNASNLVEELYKVLSQCETCTLFSEGKKRIWRSLYKSLADDKSSLILSWKAILDKVSFLSRDLVRQKLTFYMIEILIQKNITPPVTEENVDDIEKLPEREQNVVRYVAGYIPYVLEKHFKKYCQNNQKFNDILELISLFRKKCDTQKFLEFTTQWIDCRNRGGLFVVSDNAYLFFRSMEYAVRKVFNVNLLKRYRGQNLREVLLQNMLQDRRIIHHWDAITKNSEIIESIKTFLLRKIMIYWIDIRGNAFVRAWVDQQRQINSSMSKKGDHSLRKDLPS